MTPNQKQFLETIRAMSAEEQNNLPDDIVVTFAEYEQLEKQANLTATQQEYPILSKVAPYSAQVYAQGGEPGFREGIKDVASLPGRFLTTAMQPDFSNMAKTSEEHQGLLPRAVSHPLTGVGAAVAPFAGLAAAGIPAAAGLSGIPALLGMGVVAGGAEGVATGVAQKYMYPETGMDEVAQTALIPMALGGAIPPIASGLMSPLAKRAGMRSMPLGTQSPESFIKGTERADALPKALDLLRPNDKLLSRTAQLRPQAQLEQALGLQPTASGLAASMGELVARESAAMLPPLASVRLPEGAAPSIAQGLGTDVASRVENLIRGRASRGNLSAAQRQALIKVADDATQELGALDIFSPPEAFGRIINRVVEKEPALASLWDDVAKRLSAGSRGATPSPFPSSYDGLVGAPTPVLPSLDVLDPTALQSSQGLLSRLGERTSSPGIMGLPQLMTPETAYTGGQLLRSLGAQTPMGGFNRQVAGQIGQEYMGE